MNTQVNKIKTIDVIALEWFDRINGNSYFAGTVTVNYGTPEAIEFKMPFQYGYGDHYKDVAMNLLHENGLTPDRQEYTYERNGKKHSNGFERMWKYADRNGIIVRTTKHENCKKRELKNI